MPRSNLSWFRAPALTRMGNNIGLSLSRPPLTAFDQAVKRAMDVVLASLILIAVLPLMLMIAVAIWAETGGAVLFLQQRHGFNQKTFKILKFRTMTTAEDGDRVVQATSGDRRITAVGRILRRSSLDELPQLFNVLKGDMSLVGPRPHALAHTREYEEKIAFYAHRHNVKPGLTGWAQVNGYRGETNAAWKMEKRVEHDLYYIDNWSLMLDLKILIMTVFSESTFKNAG
jgi:exopolysaccharide biosynthesis polyprenyl glycosylphosphotransferase